jgi:site-specific recombinase XerD
MFDPGTVNVTGPLQPYVEGFWAALMRQGYTPLSGRNLLRLAAHLSRWLQRRGLQPGELTEEHARQFAAHRRRKDYVGFRSTRALSPILSYLRGIGVVPPPLILAPVLTPLERLVTDYTEYLQHERGLVRATIHSYCAFARKFLAALKPRGWRDVTASDVVRFAQAEFRGRGVGDCKWIVSELRSLLRYLHVRGEISRDLSACVPAVAGWRLATLPQALEPSQLKRLLASRRRRTVVGCRDYAVLCLLSRLGLRAGEVAALTLDDVDWRAGELVVHGKGRTVSRLPLPDDVGRALAAYLAKRPRLESRALFLSAVAPRRPIGTQAILGLVTRALRGVGVASGSAHRLRHTAATQMLRAGASLAEVGHVLRHRHLDTTAIYAKVDDASLRALARPWPRGDR